MTYTEIEIFLKEHQRTATIEALRVAIGDEAVDLTKTHGAAWAKEPDECAARAREYYADDITKWLAGDMADLDPETLLGLRARYVKSWAFARIIHSLCTHVDNEEEEEVDSSIGDDALARICISNAELGLRCVELIQEVKEYASRPRHDLELERIQDSLDGAKAPHFHDITKRELTIPERVDTVLANWCKWKTEKELEALSGIGSRS